MTEKPSDQTGQTSAGANQTPIGSAQAQPPGAVARVQSTAKKGYEITKLVVLAALAVVAVLFIIRNWEDVELDFVIGDAELPLALVMIGSGLVGAAIGLLVYWLSFRKSS